MKKKVLICGVSGFMGMNIAEKFIKDEVYDVYGIAKAGNRRPDGIEANKFYTCDLTNQNHVSDVIKTISPDIIIQAAATTSGVKDIINKPYLHVTNNAVMNSLLLREAYENGVGHFIFLSCGVMYQPGEESRKEEDFNESDEIYKSYFGVGWTKVYVEKMMEFYSRLGRTKHTVVRHSNTYGPYDKYGKEESHMFAATIDKVMKAKNGDTIEVWGTGEETARDLLYVDDVTDFIFKALDKQNEIYELYNVGCGQAYTVKQCVNEIIVAAGKDINIKYNADKPVIATKLALDCTKAKTELGWYPKTPIFIGIKKTMEWYKNNVRK